MHGTQVSPPVKLITTSTPALVGAPVGLAVVLVYPLDVVRRRVVHPEVRAEGREAVELLRRARAHDDLRAHHLGEQQAGGAHPAARAEHEHALPRPDPSVLEHHAVGGPVGDGQGSGRLEIHAVRHADELAGGDEAVLGEPAVHRLAHEPALDPVHGVHQHPVAAPPPFHSGTDLRHLARDVESRDDGEGEGGCRALPRRVKTSW